LQTFNPLRALPPENRTFILAAGTNVYKTQQPLLFTFIHKFPIMINNLRMGHLHLNHPIGKIRADYFTGGEAK
jgi:hypothetical protein